MAIATSAAVFSMNDRETAIRGFLSRAGWDAATRQEIPGDASFRRYERLRLGAESAILMDAPPERENTSLFVNAQRYLLHAGMPAPKLLYGEADEGLLLLEDFGDRSVTKALIESPVEERAIYRDAVDVLAEMASRKLTLLAPSGCRFPAYDEATLMREIELLADWFLPVMLEEEAIADAAEAFRSIWRMLIAAADLTPQVVVHRDYHADNLFLLAGKSGRDRIGLLDFQDALIGRAAYDPASLLTDARRDVAPDVAEAMIRQFLVATGYDEAAFRAEYAFYAAQRNAKILGIFMRLYRRDSKPRYLDLIPRVFAHFEASLMHPVLAPLKQWRETWLPESALRRLPHLRRELTQG